MDGNFVNEDDRLVQVSKGVKVVGEVLQDDHYDETGNLLGRGRSCLRNEGFSNFLFDAQILTVADGEVLARFEYGAYGELLPGSFDSVGLALRFVGALGVRTDLETGLLYMRHRWYCPASQRFISRDPIGLYGGSNLYAYAEAMPQSVADEMGLKPPPRPVRPQGRPTRGYISPQMEAEMMRISPAGYRAVMGAGQFNIPVRPGWGPGSLPGSTQQQSGPSPQTTVPRTPILDLPFPEASQGRDGSGRGKQNKTHQWIFILMQQEKEPGEDECTWLRKKIKEVEDELKRCKSPENKKRLRDLEQQWKVRCRGWRGTSWIWVLQEITA